MRSAGSRGGALVLGDDLGPRGQRRVRIASVVTTVLALALVVLVIRRFEQKDQLTWAKWRFVADWRNWRFLLRGLRNTLTASVVAMALALLLGALGAFGRLSPVRSIRALSILLIEALRATPLVLLIFLMGVFIPRHGPDLGAYWYLVAGLAAYNGSVIAEVFRAGVRSLGSGQREAGLAIGLSESAVLRQILFPQAARRMAPALVNQLVTLLKDSSLGALVLIPAVEDLLHQGKILGEFNKNPLQSLIVTALLYVVVCVCLSQLARWLERRSPAR